MLRPWHGMENQRLRELGSFTGLLQAVLAGALWRGGSRLRWPSRLTRLRLSGERSQSARPHLALIAFGLPVRPPPLRHQAGRRRWQAEVRGGLHRCR